MPNTFCPYFNKEICQSCELLTLTHADQISKKVELVQELLKDFYPFEFEKSYLSPEKHFRNRAKWIVTGTTEKATIGILGKVDLDQGRDILECPIHHPKITEISKALPPLIRKYKISPYHIKKRQGELKAILLYYSPISDSMYLKFVMRSKIMLKQLKQFSEELQNTFIFLKCFSLNIQPIAQAILEGPEEIILGEKKNIPHTIVDFEGIKKEFLLSPTGFVQSNFECSSELYRNSQTWLKEIKTKKLLELYCGQGFFSLLNHHNAEKITAIEINKDAIETAKLSAKMNNIENIQFIDESAEQALIHCTEDSFDTLIVNPPRRGLANSIKVIEKLKPQHILYSSCHIESFVEDFLKLKDFYQINKVKLFDMFPHTKHFETLILMERKRGN